MVSVIGTIVAVLWVIAVIFFLYEIWRAPVYDDNFKEIKPAKKLRDLFK